MKKIIIVKILFLTLLSLSSCNSDNEIIETQQENSNNKNKLMEETSILLGKVLTNPEVKMMLNNKIQEINKEEGLISFAYLFGNEEGLRKNEKKVLKSRNSSELDLFKDLIKEEFENNSKDYSTINNLIKSKKAEGFLHKESNDVINDIANTLISEKLQVYYPYGLEQENNNKQIEEYYVSYAPMTYTLTNDGHKFVVGNSDYEVISEMNNDFLDERPVYVIIPIDPCDIDGEPCDTIELIPAPLDVNGNLLPSGDLFKLHNPSGIKLGVGGNFTTTNPVTELLKKNTNHNNIPESDVISTYIPKIKITSKEWMGFGGTHQKIRMFRGTPDGKVTQNTNGTISVDGNSYLVKEYRCKRKYLGDHWLSFDTEFDPDWNMSENTQVMALFSIHKISSSVSVKLSVKAGYKLENGKAVPFADATVGADVNVSSGSSIFRGNTELSRRQILASIVGNGTTGETIEDGGVYYNVKKSGIVKYYFKHYHTKL